MECRERVFAGCLVVAVDGEVDLSNAEAFQDILQKAVDKAVDAVVLDFSGLVYISSAGLRVLMIANKAAKQKKVALAIGAMRPVVKEIFQISRFHLVFPCLETVREAVEKVAPAALPHFDQA